MIDTIKRLEELREKIKNEHPDYSEKRNISLHYWNVGLYKIILN